MSGHSVFELGTVRLQRGMTVPNARLAYKTYGTLAPDKFNVVLYPTSYGAQHTDTEWLIDPDRILDPGRWFVVVPNMSGKGLYTSPSHIGQPFAGGRSQAITHCDTVHDLKRLLDGVLGVGGRPNNAGG